MFVAIDLLLKNGCTSDAIILDEPEDTAESPVIMGQTTCTGSEKYLNECIHDITPLNGGGCVRANISCRPSSSKKTEDAILWGIVLCSYY